MARKANPKSSSDSPLGLEAKLWQAADKLRDNMDAAEYKPVVLPFSFSSISPTLSKNTMPNWLKFYLYTFVC